jgi:hypothetical protein
MFESISNKFQIHSNFDRSKQDFPELKNFEIKYRFEGFERNTFPYRNLFKFEMDFKRKK